MATPSVFCIAGTRPEAIKMAPVIRCLRANASNLLTVVVSTGQHREMLAQALGAFGIEADYDLDVMEHGQTLSGVTSKVLSGLDALFSQHQPDMVLAQGDTTTVLATAMTCFYRSVPFGHVEAGLRTGSLSDPFPEEFNRRVAGIVATLHFAPTEWARDNLIREGVPNDRVFVTGNTGIDAALQIAKEKQHEWFPEHKGRLLMLTTHRRENWGEPQVRIARAVRRLVDAVEDLLLVVPVHPNPDVRKTMEHELGGHGRVRLIAPQDYDRFVKLMQRSKLILTDSGGIQEEAPAFGIPVLVLRNNTERPEGISAGTAKLVGTDEDAIFKEGLRLLTNEMEYQKMTATGSPYGDGKAAERIQAVVSAYLKTQGALER